MKKIDNILNKLLHFPCSTIEKNKNGYTILLDRFGYFSTYPEESVLSKRQLNYILDTSVWAEEEVRKYPFELAKLLIGYYIEAQNDSSVVNYPYIDVCLLP